MARMRRPRDSKAYSVDQVVKTTQTQVLIEPSVFWIWSSGPGRDVRNCNGRGGDVALVKVCTAEEVAAGSADELTTAVL
jgi:hypothetical protein